MNSLDYNIKKKNIEVIIKIDENFTIDDYLKFMDEFEPVMDKIRIETVKNTHKKLKKRSLNGDK